LTLRLLLSCCLFLFVLIRMPPPFLRFFCFNAPAPTQLYTLSLHDALPISARGTRRARRTVRNVRRPRRHLRRGVGDPGIAVAPRDRKSTRLNSSHGSISYAVFCLKKKKKINT